MDEPVDSGKREQVAKQCQAVAHMAKTLASVNTDYAALLRAGAPLPLEIVGARTAYLMEVLGDILNDMDAVDEEEDGWIDPVIAEAQRLWPSDAR